MMQYLIGLGGLLIGLAIAGYFIMRLRTRVAVLDGERKFALADAERLRTEGEQKAAQMRQDAANMRERLLQQQQERLDLAKQEYVEALRAMREQHEHQMGQQLQLVREQMNSASERILKERAEELSTKNREQLSTILTPLQSNIQQMREAVEKSGREHTITMQRLDASIAKSFELSREVGERADRLTQALTGENKTQGNFGELKLKQLLQDMGLEEGVQFELQETLRDAEGYTVKDDNHRLIPDAILHFPDNRDVIIDSKMSFTAFEEYCNTKDADAQSDALRRHIASMRTHVSELAKKNYPKYMRDDHARLDFVLMYVFSESALQLALANDTTLWKEAYDKGVIISGSQNLYMILRVLELTWKQTRQYENQQQIIALADELVDRVQLFAERMADTRKQLERTAESFDKLRLITADKGKSIVTSARKLLKMGASENAKRNISLTSLAIDEETQPASNNSLSHEHEQTEEIHPARE
ncbi:MAG: DNA recombination protein RmuC [Bacteroidaceae bacterium]|nr:DNA recombination protein RmuC [Bacteroidaceae bacterium]